MTGSARNIRFIAHAPRLVAANNHPAKILIAKAKMPMLNKNAAIDCTKTSRRIVPLLMVTSDV